MIIPSGAQRVPEQAWQQPKLPFRTSNLRVSRAKVMLFMPPKTTVFGTGPIGNTGRGGRPGSLRGAPEPPEWLTQGAVS